jgi:Cft2 family RNA processing exonuclease
MFEWADDLKLRDVDLYLDSRRPRRHCFVSHAHSDHIAVHEAAIATPVTAALLHHRLGPQNVIELPHGDAHNFDPDTQLKTLPAGHIFGSAMLHVRRPEGSLLYTGDFKLRSSLTVTAAIPEPADVLVMECTYGQPFFRFPPWREVADELIQKVHDAITRGHQPIVMGYALGKAQEAIRLLTDAGIPVTLHGAVFNVAELYQKMGVPLGPFRRYRYEDFHGPTAIDLHQRGALIAPPNVARSAFTTKFKNPYRVMLSGWGLLKNAKYRYGVDEVLPLSDHADFDELLELIDRVGPKKIFTHHGPEEFADHLRARGLDATPARPNNQLLLFGNDPEPIDGGAE